MKKYTLVAYLGKFGLNYSGGSSATVYLLKELVKYFEKVVVICEEEGEHDLIGIDVLQYNNRNESIALLRKYEQELVVGYVDFSIGKTIIETDIPFYITYHDNWPELQALNLHSESFSTEQIETYKVLFNKARHVFSVSRSKLDFIKKYANSYSVVRNGLTQKRVNQKASENIRNGELKVMMAGNIDRRKYQSAKHVFEYIESSLHKQLTVDIYGNAVDHTLLQELNEYSFVNVKGFEKELDYAAYDLFLSTSISENLPLTIVDALASNTPVISYAVGGIGEVVNSRNGVLIELENREEMALAISKIIRNSIKIDQFTFEGMADYNWGNSAKNMVKAIQETI